MTFVAWYINVTNKSDLLWQFIVVILIDVSQKYLQRQENLNFFKVQHIELNNFHEFYRGLITEF